MQADGDCGRDHSQHDEDPGQLAALALCGGERVARGRQRVVARRQEDSGQERRRSDEEAGREEPRAPRVDDRLDDRTDDECHERAA